MAIQASLKAAVSAAWRKARSLARGFHRALAGTERPDSRAVTRGRDESVFQPRKH